MAPVRGNLDPIAGLEIEADIVRLELQPRRACHEHDEFVLGLIVPEVGRARLSSRDDAFDAQPRMPLDQAIDLLLGQPGRQACQEVPAAQPS